MAKPKILIVEDNQLTSTLIFSIFDSLKCEVKEINDGSDAMPYLKNNPVDVLILDLELPGMNGDEIYSQLKADPTLSQLEVIPFTAHGDNQSPSDRSINIMKLDLQLREKPTFILHKFDDKGGSKNITREIVDRVVYALIIRGVELTPEIENFYADLYQIKPDQILKYLETQR